MAEFKIEKSIDLYIENLKTAADHINENYKKIDIDEVDTLKTAKEMIAQDEELKKLMKLYADLLKKEAADLKLMCEAAEKMDSQVGQSYRAGK